MAGCTPKLTQQDLAAIRFPHEAQPRGIARANEGLAEDFVDLALKLETGETLPGILRYDAPILVYLRGPALTAYRPELDSLLTRLREEAGINIAVTTNPDVANINIEAVRAARIRNLSPTTACFVVTGKPSFADYLRRRGRSGDSWQDQSRLENAVIFLPIDMPPQEIRDCLHEELTQALGLANDLDHLTDSIWNDDNVLGIATPFDMLMLRTLYAPELKTGMTRRQASEAALHALNRLNPAGRGGRARRHAPEDRDWSRAMTAASAQHLPEATRYRAAVEAFEIASKMKPVDHRRDLALLMLGRLVLRKDAEAAGRYFEAAHADLARKLGRKHIRTAHAGLHVATLAMQNGDLVKGERLADAYIPVARRQQNAILLASFLSIKATALLKQGDIEAAKRARIESLRWARYGFGDATGSLAAEQAKLSALIAPAR